MTSAILLSLVVVFVLWCLYMYHKAALRESFLQGHATGWIQKYEEDVAKEKRRHGKDGKFRTPERHL